jgi:outer membrane protein assembly factor BamE (lipoprotein component of BamABCDE complex)
MKVLKWIMKALVVLVTIITLIVVFSDELEHTYNKLTWTPPMEINGITIGMTRSDVVFKLGEPKYCSEDKSNCSWDDYYVEFKDDVVVWNYIGQANLPLLPFKDTQSMKSLLGDEDILYVSKDFNSRSYTYLKLGVMFLYQNDRLTDYGLGKLRWHMLGGPLGKYVIKGTVVCPSAECPFDDEGDVKEDFKDRDYTYFIK